MITRMLLLGLPSLFIACVAQKPLDYAPELYEGQDVKAEFLKEYSGQFQLPSNEHNSILGISPGISTITINADGSYALKSEVIKTGGDKRTAVCTFEEKGSVGYVQKFTKTKDAVQVSGVRVGHFDAVGGLIVLRPEATKLATIDKANAPSEADIKKYCTREDERVLFIEEFLRDSFLLARLTDAQGATKFFLEGRLAVKTDVPWIWLDGELAKKAITETSQITRKGIAGIDVLGGNVDTSKQLALTVESNFDVSSDRLWLKLGAKVAETSVAFMDISGMLEGVSYSPSAGQIIIHVSDFASAGINFQLGEEELSTAVSTKISETWKALQPHSNNINSLADKANKVLTIQLSTRDNETMKIESKVRQPVR